MRALLLLAMLTAVCGAVAVAAVAGTAGGGEPAAAAFRLADGTAACAYADGRIACRARGNSTAIVLERGGASDFSETRVDWGASTPVLARTQSWWHDGISCRVHGGRIACRAAGGTISVGVR